MNTSSPDEVHYSSALLDHLFTEVDRDRDQLMVELQKKYLPTQRDVELEKALLDLIRVSRRHDLAKEKGANHVVGRLGEDRSLWVVGNPGVGKTRALERLFLKLFPQYAVAGSYCPLITVNAQSPFTLAKFACSIIEVITGVDPGDLKEKKAWSIARRLMKDRIRFLHIDEAQNFIETNNPVEITRGRNSIRGLMQDKVWPVALIFSGKPDALKIGNGDFQVGRRRRIVNFLDMDTNTYKPYLQDILTQCAEITKLLIAKDLNDDFLERLMHASMRRFGVAVEYMHDAVDEAWNSSSTILELKLFEAVYASRSGCSPDHNVFTMEGWTGEQVPEASLRLDRQDDNTSAKAPAKIERKP